MSNLSGNYKIHAGEVQGVDVVREQERRARLQLLDEIREPSPQPIFGEPVKVELEDETSRRLKNTLGDFTQVINDKNLLGISRTTSSTAGHGGTQSGRNSSTSKRPPIVNGIFKPSISNIQKHPPTEKRPGYPRNKPHDSMNCPTSLHSDSRLKDQSQWEKSHLRNVGASPSLNGANLNYNSVNPACPNSSNSASIKVNPHHGRNGTVSNTAAQAPKFVEGSSSAPPPKRIIFRPLKLPERRPEKPVESPKKDQDLETILREMKQAVPPPLTAIQTPRTEESGFPFPDDPKEEIPSYPYSDDKKMLISPTDVVPPPPPELPKLKEEPNSRHSTPSPLLKRRLDNTLTPVDVVDSSPSSNTEPGRKEPDTYKLGESPQKADNYTADPEPMDINSSPFLETEKATELLESLLNESDKCISSSLQEDLEMSESEDEVEVDRREHEENGAAAQSPSSCGASLRAPQITLSEFKSTEAKDTSENSAQQKSPLNSGIASTNSSSAVNTATMDAPQSAQSAASNSSDSSDSEDSDSDDSSSSDSSDSESNASSEASDADTPSKMWGLSNFFDETRKIHSPAFVPMDTSTNSSTVAVKEEPPIVRQDASYSLVDENTTNNNLRNHVGDKIPKFLELDPSVNIKNEVLSPITSPMHPPAPTAPLLPPKPLLPPPPPPPPASSSNSQTVRGPRTPPSPSYSASDEQLESNRANTLSENSKSENSVTAELTAPLSQTVKHSGVQQNSCDMKEDSGKVQTTVSKKRLSKNKNEVFSPRTDSSPVSHSFEDDEHSASKGLNDVSIDKDENCVATLTSSYSVPSETSDSSHDNYSIKTRQKVSKSSTAKKSKTVCEESLSQSCQKGVNVSKSAGSKVKHISRTRRTSDDVKQLTKTVKSSKSDLCEDVKKSTIKSDQKEKVSSEKNKNVSKSASNLKGISKTSTKIKKKPLKPPSKPTIEGKKSEVKKKKSKFHIENFLQSPTVSQSESGTLLKVPSVLSPSPERSPIPDYKNPAENKRKPSVSPHASRSPSRSAPKPTEKGKSNEKLRRSTRCSERASSIAQAESSALSNQDSDLSKKTIKRTPKSREHIESPFHVECPPTSLLSPIPQISPIPTTVVECAIPRKIMVSIPLDKLTRLPSAARALGSEIKTAAKRSQQHIDDNMQKKDSVFVEKSSKNASNNKRALTKDIKYKSRTDSDSKIKSNKSTLETKKDKNVKTSSEPSSSVKSKTSSNICKISIKTSDSKQSWSNDNKSSKKRKSEGDEKQSSKKKIKTYPDVSQDRSQSSRTDSPSHLSASTSKSKGLERCDSVSSLSSLSSQKSQRSSKEKRNSVSSESKRDKIVPVKHIKQEKDDKMPKVTIKKEPGTPEKCKETSRDKLHPKEDEKSVETMWNDTSSQYSPWGETCKDDPKGLPNPHALIDSVNRICSLDWENEMKCPKEASNHKHNNPPIMPMDYYYTEGRKQRHLAEREKDPFAQTLKFFEATVLFILTSQQREEYTKEPESVYQFYRETLNFSKYVSNLILENVRLQQCSPGSMEFKVLVLLLRCQALLHVKLYNLKLKEIKEQQKHVSEFFHGACPQTVRSLNHPTPSNPKMQSLSIPSPLSPTPSPASSVNSQTSGYSSSDVTSCHRNLPHFNSAVTITQNMLETICRQHTHLTNLHMGHDLWEQADMYMTRSNLREFFREVADQSENLTLHSSIKDLVNYVQCGISLVKKCCR